MIRPIQIGMDLWWPASTFLAVVGTSAVRLLLYAIVRDRDLANQLWQGDHALGKRLTSFLELGIVKLEQLFMSGLNTDFKFRRRIVDLDRRLAEMNKSGTEVAVLSLNPPVCNSFATGTGRRRSRAR